MKKVILITTSLAVLLAALAWRVSTYRRTPPGQAPLSSLNVQSFQHLFNSSADATRLLVMLSPN